MGTVDLKEDENMTWRRRAVTTYRCTMGSVAHDDDFRMSVDITFDRMYMLHSGMPDFGDVDEPF